MSLQVCPQGHSLQPRTLEALLFLNQNKSLWNLALTALIVNEKDSETADGNEENEEEYEEHW